MDQITAAVLVSRADKPSRVGGSMMNMGRLLSAALDQTMMMPSRGVLRTAKRLVRDHPGAEQLAFLDHIDEGQHKQADG